MKYLKPLTLLFFGLIISLYSCQDKKSSPKKETPTQFVPNVAEASQNAVGVWHYTCLKGCPGGAGSAINCATCGSTLVHNVTYHGNANNTQSSAPFSSPQVNPIVSPAVIPTTTEPSQNNAGAWHYTCAKGCTGGSGNPGNCATCGNTLVHNATYHGNNTQSPAPPVPPTVVPTKTEPNQNSAGVWHYACTKGCTGGSGTAGNCGTCGNALAHNVAYHQ